MVLEIVRCPQKRGGQVLISIGFLTPPKMVFSRMGGKCPESLVFASRFGVQRCLPAKPVDSSCIGNDKE